jgi:hypothetical protein
MLLPIWIAVYLYAGRSFQVLVNGRTGKVIGQRPYSEDLPRGRHRGTGDRRGCPAGAQPQAGRLRTPDERQQWLTTYAKVQVWTADVQISQEAQDVLPWSQPTHTR